MLQLFKIVSKASADMLMYLSGTIYALYMYLASVKDDIEIKFIIYSCQ